METMEFPATVILECRDGKTPHRFVVRATDANGALLAEETLALATGPALPAGELAPQGEDRPQGQGNARDPGEGEGQGEARDPGAAVTEDATGAGAAPPHLTREPGRPIPAGQEGAAAGTTEAGETRDEG